MAQTGGDTQVFLQLLQYGVLGLVVLGALLGWIWFKPGVDRLLADIERQNERIDGLVKVYEEKVIPTLTEANRLLTRLTDFERREHRREER